MKQETALKHLKSDRNVFLTGQPGTGKTYLINQYISWCVSNGIIPSVTASTGIAAIHVKGRTLHSFAGVRNDNTLTAKDIEGILDSPFRRTSLSKAEVLIIDEISMVSAKLLNAVDKLLRICRNSDDSFGGLKVIAVGDFFQLPPVKGDFAFTAESWKQADFKVCYLHEQYRQSDKVFNDILTGIRKGELDKTQKQIIRDRVVEDAPDDAIRLDTHNRKVDQINEMKLDLIDADAQSYQMSEYGNDKVVKALKASCLSPELLILKVGAKVMFTKNDIQKRWVNGTQGEVVQLDEYSVKVELRSGVTHDVGIEEWSQTEGYGKYAKVIASVMQIPLKLAYAITIHKSQGMTLDEAIIDVSHVFECGQAYVAISRVRSLEGVHLQGFLTKKFLAVHEEVVEMDKEFLSVGMDDD